MYDTRVLPIGAAGTGLRAWVLPGGFQVAGIKVDNKCGSWLALPDGAFVPPYTIGWGHSFQPTLASIDILFSVGPASQVSTQQGDKPVITIYSEPVGESPGIPSGGGTAFVEQFTPVQYNGVLIPVPQSTGQTGQLLFSPIANKRYRLLTLEVIIGGFTSAPPISNFFDGSVTYFINSSVTLQSLIAGLVDTAHHPVDMRSYPNGLDFPISEGISFDAFCDWGSDQGIAVTASAYLV